MAQVQIDKRGRLGFRHSSLCGCVVNVCIHAGVIITVWMCIYMHVEACICYGPHTQRAPNTTLYTHKLLPNPPPLDQTPPPHPQQGGWPLPASYARFACRPPPAMAAYMRAFTAFYHGLDVGRGKRLEWVLREVGDCRLCICVYVEACGWLSLSIMAWTSGGENGSSGYCARSVVVIYRSVGVCVGMWVGFHRLLPRSGRAEGQASGGAAEGSKLSLEWGRSTVFLHVCVPLSI